MVVWESSGEVAMVIVFCYVRVRRCVVVFLFFTFGFCRKGRKVGAKVFFLVELVFRLLGGFC